jgi:hypothetical protein
MKSLFWLMPLFSMFYACAPILKKGEIKPLSVATRNDTFPKSWFGRWKGSLEIYNAKGLAQTVPMMLIMDKTDTAGVYKWHIQYGADTTKGLRPYLLRTIDATKGLYVCDELNSIQMESYLLGNRLFCSFNVMGNVLLSTYEKQGDNMLFEIVMWKENPVSVTGNTKAISPETEDVPPVKSYPVIVHQRAVLKRHWN